MYDYPTRKQLSVLRKHVSEKQFPAVSSIVLCEATPAIKRASSVFKPRFAGGIVTLGQDLIKGILSSTTWALAFRRNHYEGLGIWFDVSDDLDYQLSNKNYTAASNVVEKASRLITSKVVAERSIFERMGDTCFEMFKTEILANKKFDCDFITIDHTNEDFLDFSISEAATRVFLPVWKNLYQIMDIVINSEGRNFHQKKEVFDLQTCAEHVLQGAKLKPVDAIVKKARETLVQINKFAGVEPPSLKQQRFINKQLQQQQQQQSNPFCYLNPSAIGMPLLQQQPLPVVQQQQPQQQTQPQQQPQQQQPQPQSYPYWPHTPFLPPQVSPGGSGSEIGETIADIHNTSSPKQPLKKLDEWSFDSSFVEEEELLSSEETKPKPEHLRSQLSNEEARRESNKKTEERSPTASTHDSSRRQESHEETEERPPTTSTHDPSWRQEPDEKIEELSPTTPKHDSSRRQESEEKIGERRPTPTHDLSRRQESDGRTEERPPTTSTYDPFQLSWLDPETLAEIREYKDDDYTFMSQPRTPGSTINFLDAPDAFRDDN